MSDHDDDRYLERLRSVDRPRRPDADADERIRSEMFAAFDESAARQDDAVEDVADIIVLDDTAETTERSPGRSTNRAIKRGWFYAAAAAVILLIGTVATLTVGDGDDGGGFAERGTLVTAFCTDIRPWVDIVADFNTRPGGERSTRALIALEALGQRVRELGDQLEGDEGQRVRDAGDGLLSDAAEARILSGSRSAGLDDALRALAVAVADEIDLLPGTQGCRTDQLRNES